MGAGIRGGAGEYYLVNMNTGSLMGGRHIPGQHGRRLSLIMHPQLRQPVAILQRSNTHIGPMQVTSLTSASSINKLFNDPRGHAEEPRTSEIAMPQFMHTTTTQGSKDGFSPAPTNTYKDCEGALHPAHWLGEEVKRTDYMLLNITILFILSALIMGIVFFSLWDELLDEIWILYLGFFITLILVASALAFVRLHFYLKSRGYNLLLRTGLELEYHKVVGTTPPQDPKDRHHGNQDDLHGNDSMDHHHSNEEVRHRSNEEVQEGSDTLVAGSETLVAETQLVV